MPYVWEDITCKDCYTTICDEKELLIDGRCFECAVRHAMEEIITELRDEINRVEFRPGDVD
jgi:hypothetical protein